MAIFISYSHEDKEFVDDLAMQLVIKKAHVWLDRWELNTGDSIIERIQDAMDAAIASIVVLTPASTQTAWCKKELSSGILKELEKREVLVLPLLKEDCEIPLFLRDKLYADFRHSFDEGFNSLLKAIAKYTSDTRGRIESPDFHTDWAFDWGERSGMFLMQFIFAQHSKKMPYTVVTEIEAIANEKMTQRYRQYEEAGLDSFGRGVFIAALAPIAEREDVRILLKDNKPQIAEFHLEDPKSGIRIDLEIKARWLGEDTGDDVLIDCSHYFNVLFDTLVVRGFTSSPEQAAKIAAIVGSS